MPLLLPAWGQPAHERGDGGGFVLSEFVGQGLCDQLVKAETSPWESHRVAKT